jgi:hypothetical protein
MPEIGDRVRVESTKLGQAVREGVVTGAVGHMLRVQWSTGEESTFMPGPGAVTVVGRVRARTSKKSARKKAASRKSVPIRKGVAKKRVKAVAKKAHRKSTAKKAAPKKAAPKKAAPKKAAPKKRRR